MSLTAFTNFSRLPTELQVLILEYAAAEPPTTPGPASLEAMPYRVFWQWYYHQQNFPDNQTTIIVMFFRYFKRSAMEPQFVTRYNLLRTSKFTRQVVLETWKSCVSEARDRGLFVQQLSILHEYLEKQIWLASGGSQEEWDLKIVAEYEGRRLLWLGIHGTLLGAN